MTRFLISMATALSLLLTACAGSSRHAQQEIRASLDKGEECLTRNNPREAMKHFLSAYEESLRQDNHYLHAQSAERISDLFFNAYDYTEAIRYRKEAVEAYALTDSLTDKLRAEHRLEMMQERDGKTTLRMQLQDSIFSAGYRKSNLDSILLDMSGCRRMSPLIAVTRMYGLDYLGDILQSILPYREKLEGAIYTGNLLRQEHNLRASDSILTEAKPYARSHEERIMILYALFRNARSEGEAEKALDLADSIFHCQEAITNRIMTADLAGAHSEYYAEQSLRNHMKSRFYLGISVIIAVFLGLVSFCIWRILHMKNRAQRAELEANIESLIRMKAYADMQKLTIEDIRRTHENINAENNRILESLFRDKWAALNRLCEEYYATAGSQKMKESLIRKIESEIRNIGSDDGLLTIEREVNRHLGGIVEKLRSEYPELRHKDIAFCTLLLAGFTTKAICFILDIRIGNFYVKKGRLIKKIKESDSLHKEEFLTRLRCESTGH